MTSSANHEWVEITCINDAYLTYICAHCGKLGYAARHGYPATEGHSNGGMATATRAAY